MWHHAKLISDREAKAMRHLAHERLRAIVRFVSGGGLALVLTMAPAVAGDIELGRYLSSECMTCHGAAKSDSTIPPIHGLDQRHFVEVLKAYRAKALPNPAMQNIAGHLRDEDIAALAAYFAAAKPR
jgi:cytochrome c553